MSTKPRSVKVRRHKKSGLWCANLGPPDSRGKATTIYAPRENVKTEAQAWRWLDGELRAREQLRVSARDPSLFGLCQMYLAHAEGRVDRGLSDRDEYRRTCSRLGLAWDWTPPEGAERIGDWRASAVGAETIEAAIEGWLAEGYKPHYIANIVRSLKAVYGWACKPVVGRSPSVLLSANPIIAAKPPTIPHSPERFAERTEIAAFLRFFRRYADGAARGYKGTVKPRTHAGRKSLECRFDRLTILAERAMIHTGARPGEICDLRWSDIRWDAGTTSAGHTFARAVIPPERWKAGGKTGRPRTIYLSPTLTRAIRRESERSTRHPTHVFPHRCGPRDRMAGSARETGAPWESTQLAAKIRKVRRRMIADWVDSAIAEAAKDGRTLSEADAVAMAPIRDDGPNRVVNYRWRHTSISTLLMLGIDVATVAELTGTSADMIRRNYGHLLDQHLARAADVLHMGARGAALRR